MKSLLAIVPTTAATVAETAPALAGDFCAGFVEGYQGRPDLTQ